MKLPSVNYNLFFFLNFLFLMIAFSSAAFAVGDAKAGQQKSASCQGCHGMDGNSFSPDWPHLASQNVAYLAKQIKHFRDGVRKNETMSPMAAGLSDQDIADIAAYFASQTIGAVNQNTDAETIKTGRKIFKGGNTYSGVPACAGCHGPNGVGNGAAAFPHVAGQQESYLIKTLNDFKSGVRNNDVNEIMRNIAAKMTASEIKAVASYMASLSISTSTQPTPASQDVTGGEATTPDTE